MHALFKHELKKMTRKKSVTIALICMLVGIAGLCTLFIAESAISDESGAIIHGPAAIALHKAQAKALEGPLTAEKLESILLHYQAVTDDPANYAQVGAEGTSIKDEVFGKEVQPYSDVLNLLRRAFSPAGVFDYHSISALEPGDVAGFYHQRTEKINEILDMDYSTGNHTPAEKAHILQMNDKIKTPFYFAYTKGWSDMLTRGFLSFLLMVSLVVCICVSPVFANEYQSGADAIILSSKYGKNKVIAAKILASVVFTTCVYVVAVLVFSAVMLAFHGITGWNAPFQLASFTSPYPLTMLQVFLCGLGIGYVVVLSIMSLILLLSATVKTSFAAVIAGALWIFVPMFIPSSKSSALMNDVLALLPAKAMNAFEVFSVYDTYSLFGQVISRPVAILLFSACICVVALPLAYARFKRHQVT